MSNTLTGITPVLYEALNVVAREMVGFIPAVSRDASAERAAVGQTVRSPIGVSGALEDVTPGAVPADSGDTTVGYTDVLIVSSKAAPIRWSGEEQRGVGTNGTLANIMRDQFVDGMRKLVNQIEVDIALAVKKGSSRAYGTAGTTPFATASDLSDIANARRILEDNGAAITDLQFVMNSAAMANLRGKQSLLFKVNEAGSSDMLRDGMTDRLEGFALRNSAGIVLHTHGSGTGYLVNNGAGIAVGATSIDTDTGSGTILAGDFITYAADTANKYVVSADLSTTPIVVNKPGLKVIAPDNNAITVGGSYTGNFAFSRNAVVLVARAPALPEGGDSADDRMTITDPISGLSFEVSVYRQYRRVKYEVAMAWGVAVVKPEMVATLLG